MDYRMRSRARAAAVVRRKRLDELTARLRRLDLRLRVANARRRLETADTAAAQLIRLRVTRAHGRLNPLIAHLTQLSPLKILERGYAIVTNQDGAIVKRRGDAPAESKLAIRLAQGKIAARVLRGE